MSADLANVLSPFPRERTWLLPALHAVQETLGHLPDDALERVAAHLRVPASEVHGVASGYPEFRLHARGRHHVRYCTGVTCRLTGGDAVRAALERRFAGATPAEITLEPADCFFECSVAPLIEVDGEYRGRVTSEGDFFSEGDFVPHPRWEGASTAPSQASPRTDGAGQAGARTAGILTARDTSSAREAVEKLVVEAGGGRGGGAERGFAGRGRYCVAAGRGG